ncbi:hypothetical protein NCC49_000914 [Naganishia albida]|nr:hypothetical protein NCC49_000914 [Naganishia albida]
MRFSNLAVFALSPVLLSVLASPVAQYSPPAEDSSETTTTDLQWFPMPTMIPSEAPSTTDMGFMTIQTSTPEGETTDTGGFMTIQTSIPPEVSTTDDGMFTIQTSTPNATPITTAEECDATADVDGEDEEADEWCDEGDDEGEDNGGVEPSTASDVEMPTATTSDYPTSTAPPQVDLAPGIYQIYPVRALISMCLQIAEGEEPADGTPVVIAPCDGSPEQDWVTQWYPPAGNIYIKLAGTNFCLDASFPLGNGTPMKIWTCYDGLVQQRWNYNLAAQLYLVDQGQCLDLTDGNIDNGTVCQTWECDASNGNQHWFVIAKPSA